MAKPILKITIITVVYNSVSTIADAIKSVKSQSYFNIEHLIIDGGSTDGTLDLAKGLLHPKMSIVSERDNGIYDAMNKGLLIASGDVTGFLNADDFFAGDDAVSIIADAFNKAPIEACFGDLLYLSSDCKRTVRYWKSSDFKKGKFALGWSPAHPTFYIRRSALLRHGGFNLKYRLASDVDFMMRYLECGNIFSMYIPKVLVCMRIGGVSNKSWRNVLQQNKEVLQSIRENNIRYCTPIFIISKLVDRITQKLRALLCQYIAY